LCELFIPVLTNLTTHSDLGTVTNHADRKPICVFKRMV